MEIAGKSADIGSNIANIVLSGLGFLPLPDIIGKSLSLVSIAGMSWGPGAPIIIDMTGLFDKFRKDILDSTEQMIAKQFV